MTNQLSFRIRILGIVWAAVLVSGPLSAHAESAINPCYQGVHFHPRQGGSAPANAPALVFAPGNTAHDSTVSSYQLELRAPDDSLVPFTMVQDPESSEYLIKPSTPLNTGTHRFRYRQLCNYMNPTGYVETGVSISAVATLPTAIGTAKLRSPVAEISGVATCMPVKVYAIVDVT